MPHLWCEPKCLKNVGIWDFIKDPFAMSKLRGGTSVEFSQGKPLCWAVHLAEKLRLLRYYELMHKEDADIVPHLRKYRFYLGQGIPDPWAPLLYYPGILSQHNDTEKHLKNKREDRCLCCEREYLFECPDKCASLANRCSCKDCHEKNPSASDCTVKCRCSEIFHNWLLKNFRVHHRKHKSSGDGSSTLNGSHSESEDDGTHLKERNNLNAVCECVRNRKGCYCSASEKSGHGGGDHQLIGNGCKFSSKDEKFLKQQPKIYFCPYLKHFYRRKYLENDKSLGESKKVVSKEIQAEIQPVKFSKTVQTEKPEPRAQSKCTCQNKCFACSLFCNRTWLKPSCPGIYSIRNFCCSPSFTQGTPFVCPYSFPNHCAVQQHCKNEYCELKKRHHKKKQYKELEKEEESNAELRFDQQEERVDGDKVPKGRTKEFIQEYEHTEANGDLKYNKNVINSQTPSTTFEHLKFLSDYKLKGYLQQEQIPQTSNDKYIHQNSSACSRFVNPSVNNFKQGGVPLERFKSLHYRPGYSESSFMDSKMNLKQSNPQRRYNYCNQATMTLAIGTENQESDVLIKNSISKEVIDSDEPKAYSYLKKHEFTRTLGKRRKLLRNRKRRRKLATSILEYQDSLVKTSKGTINAKKDVNIEESSRDYLKSKKHLNQNFPSTSGHLNFGENCSLGLTDVTVNSRYSFGRNSQEISRKHHLGQFTSSHIQKNY